MCFGAKNVEKRLDFIPLSAMAGGSGDGDEHADRD
jgi:hypothetical protein